MIAVVTLFSRQLIITIIMHNIKLQGTITWSLLQAYTPCSLKLSKSVQYSVPFIQTNLGKIASWARDANSRDRD